MNCGNEKCGKYNDQWSLNCVFHDVHSIRMCKDYVDRLSEPKPEPPTEYDPQSRYYDAGGIEVQEIIKAKLTREQYFGWLLGNVIKYSTRLNFKGQNVRDTQKMANYSTWAQDFMVEEAE